MGLYGTLTIILNKQCGTWKYLNVRLHISAVALIKILPDFIYLSQTCLHQKFYPEDCSWKACDFHKKHSLSTKHYWSAILTAKAQTLCLDKYSYNTDITKSSLSVDSEASANDSWSFKNILNITQRIKLRSAWAQLMQTSLQGWGQQGDMLLSPPAGVASRSSGCPQTLGAAANVLGWGCKAQTHWHAWRLGHTLLWLWSWPECAEQMWLGRKSVDRILVQFICYKLRDLFEWRLGTRHKSSGKERDERPGQTQSLLHMHQA